MAGMARRAPTGTATNAPTRTAANHGMPVWTASRADAAAPTAAKASWANDTWPEVRINSASDRKMMT